MSRPVPALPPGQAWVAVSAFGTRTHVANIYGQRTHCGQLMMLPGEAARQMVDAPEDTGDICRRCAEHVLPLARALGLVD